MYSLMPDWCVKFSSVRLHVFCVRQSLNPPMIISAPAWLMRDSRNSGSHQSSPSINVTYSPRDCFSPALRAADTPALSWVMTVTRGLSDVASCAKASVLSVLPSSIIISSHSLWVCLKTDSMHLFIVSSQLYTGRIIDMPESPNVKLCLWGGGRCRHQVIFVVGWGLKYALCSF